MEEKKFIGLKREGNMFGLSLGLVNVNSSSIYSETCAQFLNPVCLRVEDYNSNLI